jgi:hypothetical protein
MIILINVIEFGMIIMKVMNYHDKDIDKGWGSILVEFEGRYVHESREREAWV